MKEWKQPQLKNLGVSETKDENLGSTGKKPNPSKPNSSKPNPSKKKCPVCKSSKHTICQPWEEILPSLPTS